MLFDDPKNTLNNQRNHVKLRRKSLKEWRDNDRNRRFRVSDRILNSDQMYRVADKDERWTEISCPLKDSQKMKKETQKQQEV